MRSASTTRAVRLAASAAVGAGLVGALVAPTALAGEQAAPQAELVFGQTAPLDGVRPGGDAEVSFTVKNKGDAPAERVVLYLDGSHGLDFAKKYSNCVYEQTPAQDEGAAQVNAVCDIGQTLEPGVVYVPQEPLGVRVLDRALYDQISLAIQEDPLTSPESTEHVGAADPVLRLVARQPPQEPGAVYGSGRLDVDITAANAADFALTGAKVKGVAGDTVGAKVTFANKGPAWVRNDVYGPIGVFDVGVPEGTTVTRAPDFCEPAGVSAYRCTTPYSYVDEDSERGYAFRLRIDKVVANATGKVAFVKGADRWGTLPFDGDRKNNKAAIVVNAGAGGTGSGDGTVGSTSGGTGGGAGDAPHGGSSPIPVTQPDELAATGAEGTLLVGGAAGAAVLVAAGFALTSRRGRS